MSEPAELLLRATLTEHEDPDAARRANHLVAGARRRATRRRATRLALTSAAAVVAVAAGAATLRPGGDPAATPQASGTAGTAVGVPTNSIPGETGRAALLDRVFRQNWPAQDRSRLQRSAAGPVEHGWSVRYRYAGSNTGPGLTISQGLPAELDVCADPPAGPVRPALCQLTEQPDGSHLLTYERSGMDGRNWTFETLATHYRTNGEVVTVWMGLYLDDGTAAIPDWVFGPDQLAKVATNPGLTLR
jgi:hypothetical protein